MRVTCAGILVADIVRLYSQRAEPGRLVTLEEPLTLHVGGCAANTGISLAKMGVDVKIVGKLGSDYWGRFIIDTFGGYPNIDVGSVKIDESETTASTDIEVLKESGERTFYHFVGANASFCIDDISEDSYVCDVFHVGGYNLIPSVSPSDLRTIFARAHGKGASTSIDLAWSDRVEWTKLQTAMDQIDFYFSNLDEARMVIDDPEATGEGVSDTIMSMGPDIVGIKMGSKGCLVRTRCEVIEMPADPQFLPVDGTGAGDAFVAGLLIGIGEGWDIGKTARFANAVGGFCVSKPGATTGVPDRNTVLKFIRDNPLSYSRRNSNGVG
jgi:sugar/nucleoside kinase (ribokinase family)